MLMASLNHHESQTLRDWITFQISDKFLTENGIFKEKEIIFREAISKVIFLHA